MTMFFDEAVADFATQMSLATGNHTKVDEHTAYVTAASWYAGRTLERNSDYGPSWTKAM